MQISGILENPIFSKAKSQAKKLVSNRFRLVALLGAVGKKINEVEDKRKVGQEFKDKVFLFGRLLKASFSRKYKELPWKSALSITAALIYFINPADVIPDIIPFSGLMDDFTILVWTYNSLQFEIDAFSQWEKENLAGE